MEKKKKFIIDVCYAGVILLLLLLVCKYIFPILVPFITAFVIATILQIPVKKLCKNYPDKKRIVSLFVIIVFFILTVWGTAVVGLKIMDRVIGFLSVAPALYQHELVPALDSVFYEITMAIQSLDASIVQDVDNAFHKFLNNLGNYITDLSVNVVHIVSGRIIGIPGFIIKLVITLISSVFFMLDYDLVIGFFMKCIPEGKKEMVMKFQSYVKNTLLVYLKSYTLLFCMTYVELSIGFYLIGIPYAPIVGLAVAIFDILPILGTGGILLPWVVILLLMENIPMAIGMLVLYLVITVIRNTVEPKLVGKQIGLHPLATLVSMYLGLNLLGLIGMLIFPVSIVVWLNMKKNSALES